MEFKSFKLNKKVEKKIERKILGQVEKEKVVKWHEVGGKNLKQVEDASKPKQIVIPLIRETKRYGPKEAPPALEKPESPTETMLKALPDDGKIKYDVPGAEEPKKEAKKEDVEVKKETEESKPRLYEVDSENVSMSDFMEKKEHYGLYVPSKRKRRDESGGDAKRRKQGLSQILRNNRVGEGLDPKVSMDLDVATRPDESDINYDAVPIEQYGAAMLLGMGWDPKVGIGANPKVVEPVKAHIRNRSQGLGAELAPYVPRRVLKPGEKLPRQKLAEERQRQDMLEKSKKQREEKQKKKKKKRKREKPPVTWVRRNCIIRVITKDLGKQYYCKKGVVFTVISTTDFLVKMIDTNTTLTMCEDQVETVIPKTNKPVIFVKGKRKGKIATLSEKYKSKEKALVQLQDDLQLITTSYAKICAVEIS